MSIHRHGAYSALLFCAGAALAAWARTVVPASLPPAVHADTEVSTNVPFTAWEEHQKRFEHRLSFEATPSNNVQVAFGRLADAAQPTNRAQTLAFVFETRSDGAVKSLSLSSDGVGLFPSLAATPPKWLYDTRWDMFRLTARGVDDPHAGFRVQTIPCGFSLTLK